MELKLTHFLKIFKSEIKFNVRTSISENGVDDRLTPFYCTLRGKNSTSISIFEGNLNDGIITCGLSGNGNTVSESLDDLINIIKKTSNPIGTSYDDSLKIKKLIKDIDF
jgi:hypothetical protein